METITIEDSTDSEDDRLLLKAINLSKQEQFQDFNQSNSIGSSSKVKSTLTTITTSNSNSNIKRSLSDLEDYKVETIDKKLKKSDTSNSSKSAISRIELERERISRLNQKQSSSSNTLDSIFKEQLLGTAPFIPSLLQSTSSSQIPSKNYWNPEIQRVSNRMNVGDGGFSLSDVIGLKTGE